MAAITVGQLRHKLAGFDPDLQVWVFDAASNSGYSPTTGIVILGTDADPAPGEPAEFVVIDVEQ